MHCAEVIKAPGCFKRILSLFFYFTLNEHLPTKRHITQIANIGQKQHRNVTHLKLIPTEEIAFLQEAKL